LRTISANDNISEAMQEYLYAPIFK